VPKLGNLAMRFITVVPLIPLIVLAIEWRLPYGVWGIVFAATVIGIHEYFSMALPAAEDRNDRWFGVGVGVALALLLYWAVPCGSRRCRRWSSSRRSITSSDFAISRR
jgi:hypothetical protein